MKTLILTLLIFSSSFCFKSFGFDDDTLFEIKRGVKEIEQKQKQAIKPKALEYQRQSFSYSDDFVIINKPPKFHLKKGTVLKVDFIFPIPPVSDEEREVLAHAISPIQAVLFGKVKAIKNSNQAQIVFYEVVYNEKIYSIETFPVLLKGKLKDSFFKNLALDFLDSIPVFLAFSLNSSHKNLSRFFYKDLKNKTKQFQNFQKQKNQNQKMKYLKINQMKIIKVIVK